MNPRPELRAFAVAASLVPGCMSPASTAPTPAAPVKRAPTKAAIFGDAKLVPTPQGELARTELAVAGELEAVLEAAGFEPARVSVKLSMPPAAVLVLTPQAGAPSLAAAQESVRRLLPPEARVEIIERPKDESDGASAPAPGLDLLLALALLGLGASAGVTAERARRRTRSQPKRSSVKRPRV